MSGQEDKESSGSIKLPVGETEVRVDLEELSSGSREDIKGVVEELGFSLDEISLLVIRIAGSDEGQEGK